VTELFNLIARRNAIKRRYATRHNSNASDRELEVPVTTHIFPRFH
jgi:hypothetical protein